MSEKKKIERNKVFQGNLNTAMHTYLGNDAKRLADAFWHSDAIATAIENADNANKSINVLRKHLPERFHALIRFAQPKQTWYLNVNNGTTATQLNMILDELLLRIAKDIGYAPRIKIAVQPSQQTWKHSGFPLKHFKKNIVKLPSEEEAQIFLENFSKKPNQI